LNPDAVLTLPDLMMHHGAYWPVLGIFSLSLGQCLGEVHGPGDCQERDLDDRISSERTPGESLLQLKSNLTSLSNPPHLDNSAGQDTFEGMLPASEIAARRSAMAAEVRRQTRDCEPGPDAVFPPNPSTFVGESSLHDIVGPDGVLMISLGRDSSRFRFSEQNLGIAGIRPSKFLATDGKCASEDALSMGCVSQNSDNTDWCSNLKKTGWGCQFKAEQAIADSHRRALLAAQARGREWTMIVEDDTMLVRPHRWNDAFKRAWQKVPPETKIVRLSWCLPGNASLIMQPAYIDAGDFKLIKWNGYTTGYRAGGCTTAYMVHRQIIPEMLSLFPCCCAVDCCFENDLYNRVMGSSRSETRGMTIMMSMDGWGSQEYIAERERSQWGVQYGVMMQALSDLVSTRTGWKTNLKS
jgi:hypothetical protein